MWYKATQSISLHTQNLVGLHFSGKFFWVNQTLSSQDCVSRTDLNIGLGSSAPVDTLLFLMKDNQLVAHTTLRDGRGVTL